MPVYTKKDGRIFCVYYDGPKRVWEPFGRGPEARQAAETRDLEIKFKKKRGQWRTSPRVSSLLFVELAQFYIDTRARDLSANTKDGILRALATYALPVIGAKPITQITMDDWWRIQEKMTGRGISNQTINTYFVYLSKIFTWAIEENEDLLAEHPWAKRKRLRVRERFTIDLFTGTEFKRILKAAPAHLAWCLEVAYYTGVRPGPTELFVLRWADMDWNRRRIKIPSTKTDSIRWRWQYLDPDFMKRLRDQEQKVRKEYPDCPWIVSYQGKQITSVKRSFARAKEKAKITRRIRMYDIRHFYITYALAGGADLMELAERVGHKDGQMIMRVYAHLAKDLQRTTAFKLPSLYT